MKLYISNETKLHREIAELLQEHPEGVEQIIVSEDGLCFKNWLKKDAQKYKQYTDIILCRNAVIESNKEFTEALNQYQMIYTSKIIIILDVLDYELIRMLLEIGISNVIYSDNRDEYRMLLYTCMEKGLEPIYWVRKLPEDTEPNKSRAKLIALIILVFLSLLSAVIITSCILLHKSTEDETTATTNSINSPASSHTETVPLQLTTTTVTTSAGSTLSDLQTTTTETTTTTQTTASIVTTSPVVTTTPEQTTTKATVKKTSATTNKVTTKKVTTTAKTVTTTAKPKPVTTTKKVTTTSKATTTSKKATTTTKATTTLTPIRLRGLALKTVSENNTVYIKVDESTQVTPIFTPSQATNKKVYWSSNREDRAVVDSNGKVTGRSPGAVIIKCVSDDGGLSAACMIVVEE